MHRRSLALVWAALLVRANAVIQNITFGPSSSYVRLLPREAWKVVNPEDKDIPPYAITTTEGAQALFTFPQPGVNFYLIGYYSQIGKWGLCIDCKANGTVPTDHLEILLSGANQFMPGAPSAVLLSRWNLTLEAHTILLTNMLDSRFNATGQLTLEAFQVTYEVPGPVTVSVEDVTPYSRGDLVGAILGATFGTAILLVCIVYFLRKRSNSRYKPVQDQDTAAAEFNFRGGRDSQTQRVQLNLEPITSRGQYPSHPSRDTGAQYPTWSSAASSGKGRNYPQIIVTSPTVPSNASFSTESHYNIYKSMYDSQHHLASSAHEDTTYTGLPPRPSSPIPNRHARFGYSPVEGSDDGEFDVPYDPASRYDTPTLKSNRSLLDKIKRGTLPAVPIKSPDAAQPSHGRTDSRAPLILANVAPQSTRPQPEPEPRPQPQLQPRSQVQPYIQSIPHPPPDPPKTQPLAPITVPSSFQPPPNPPPAVESVGRVSSEDSHSVNIQPPDAPRDKTHFSVQVPPIPVGPPHLPSSPPGIPETGTSLSFNSQASDASVEQPALHPSPGLAFPSPGHQARPQPTTKATDTSERSHTWYSGVDSSSSPSRQYSLDSPLPSSKALSHVMHGEKKEGIAADSISPDKSSSPDGTTPSTGGPTPLSWEFPLPPGAPPLQHTKSDPYPPASAARLPRPRTKSTLSKVVATAADVEVRNNGVVIPAISESPPESVAGGSHSHPPNGVIGQGSMGSLMAVAVESSAWARKPIPPGFFDDPENEQKKLAPGTDMRGEGVGRDVNLLSDIPMFLAGSLKTDGTPTIGQTNQPGGRTENSTRTGTEDSLIPPESSNSHASFLSEDENDTLERAEIRTAELAIRSPPRNVPELARFDTIHYMSDHEERARARSRSGSNATASGSTRKRKSPDYSPPLVPPMPVDVRERRGDSSDLSSRGTSIVDSQLAAIPMSLGPTYLTNSTYPTVPWTPSPAATPLRLETIISSASSQQTTFNPTDKPPWQPLRLHSPPPRDEMRSPSTPPSVPPIPELAPISFESLMVEHPPVQGADEEPTPAEEHRAQAGPAVVTVRAASPRSHSEVNESGWQPGHTPGSSVGTTDTFGLSATISLRGMSRSRGPRPRPTHDREPSASGTSIASVIISHNTGSHGTSGSGSYNDGYPPSVDNIFGPPPPVFEQSEPDTASESHTTVPTPHKLSPKRALRPLTPVSPPTSTNPLPQMNVAMPSSSRTSVVSSTPSSSTTRPRAGSTRPAVGVRGPRDRSSSARAVLASSSASSRTYSMNQTRPVSSSSIPASQGQPPTLNPGSVAGSSNAKTDSMATNSNNSLLDLYAQSPPRSNVPIPDPLSLQSNEHPQSHPS